MFLPIFLWNIVHETTVATHPFVNYCAWNHSCLSCKLFQKRFYPFQTNVLILYLMKTSENLAMFSEELIFLAPLIQSTFWLSEDLSIGRILSEKNMWVRGEFLKKWKFCLQNLTKEQKQPPVVILQQGICYNIFILCLWIRIIRRSDQVV